MPDSLIRPGDVAGPSATTANPVLAATGFKVVDATDLVVKLPGRDFELSRHFQGLSAFLRMGSFGPFTLGGWTLSTDAIVYDELERVSAPSGGVGTPDDPDTWKQLGFAVVVPSPIRETLGFQNYFRYKPEWLWQTGWDTQTNLPTTDLPMPTSQEARLGREFRSMGPGLQRLVADVCTSTSPYAEQTGTVTLPVWRLITPGGGTTVFFRKKRAIGVGEIDEPFPGDDVPMAGKIWKQIDEYGNEWNYKYTVLENPTHSVKVARLSKIFFHGQDEATSRAWLEFLWTPSNPDPNIPNVDGICHISTINLWRPYQHVGGEGSVTDQVVYMYRSDVERVFHPDETNPMHFDWLGTPGDLVQVTHRQFINPDQNTEHWHTQVSQYRYTITGTTQSMSIQPKGAYAPEQVEALARDGWRVSGDTDTIVARGRGALLALEHAHADDDEYSVEQAGLFLMTLSDRTRLERTGAPCALELWQTATKWVFYYGHPRFNPQSAGDPAVGSPDVAVVGTVEDEFLMPGDGGHTLRQHYEYSSRVEDEKAGNRTLVMRTTRTCAPDGTFTPTSMIYSLGSTISRYTDYTRRSDAAGASTWADEFEPVAGNAAPAHWGPRRRTTHRSEDRDILATGFEQIYANSSKLTLVHVTIPFTVAELVEDVSTSLTAPEKWWTTAYLYDEHNRLHVTFDPASMTSYTPTHGPGELPRLAYVCEMARQSAGVPVGSVSTAEYAEADDDPRYGPSQVMQSITGAHGLTNGFLVMRGADLPQLGSQTPSFLCNYASTMRVVSRWAGSHIVPGVGNWQQLSSAEYQGVMDSGITGDFTGSGPAPTRPDLVLQTHEFTATAPAGASQQVGAASQDATVVYTYRGGWDPVLGAAPLSKVVVSRPRERETSENGPGGTVSTTRWINALGQVHIVRLPEGVNQGVEFDDVLGLPVAEHRNVTVTELANLATFETLGAGTFTTRTTYNFLGNAVRVVSPDGVATDYVYDRLTPEQSPTAPVVATTVVTTVPHELGEGRFAGPAVREWYNAQFRLLRTTTHTLDPGITIGRHSASQVVASLNLPADTLVGRSETDFSMAGLPVRERLWSMTPSAVFPQVQPPAADVVYRSSTVYDGDGNAIESVDPLGNVTISEYDSRSRVKRVLRTVASMAAPGQYAHPPELVEERFYDHEEDGDATPSAGGDGLLTLSESYATPSQPTPRVRGTKYWYDARKRVVLTAPVARSASGGVVAVGPCAYTAYDNLDRPILKATLAQPATLPPAFPEPFHSESELIADAGARGVTKTMYGARGLVVRTSTLLNQSSQADTAQWAVTDRWYDGLGRQIATTAANTPTVKVMYDVHGRVTTQATCLELSSDHADVANINHGFMLQRTTNDYLEGKTLLGRTTVAVRAHTDMPASGPLLDGLGTDPECTLTTYTGYAYDAAGRPVATINYGTNTDSTVEGMTSVGASVPTVIQTSVTDDLNDLPASVPANAMVSRTVYNSRGQAEIVAQRQDDGTYHQTRTYCDALGRVIATVDNYKGTDPIALSWAGLPGRWSVQWLGVSSSDENRVTTTAYDAAGHPVRQVAHLRDVSGAERVQVTANSYTWPGTGACPVPMHGPLYQVSYPSTAPATSGEASPNAYDQVHYTYNGLGEQATVEDQNGTVREFVRDAAGRLIADRVQTFGSRSGPIAQQHPPAIDVDQTVDQIITKYDLFGRVEASISCLRPGAAGTPPDPTSGTATLLSDPSVQNFVRYTYNYAGAVTVLRESADGREPASSDPKVREVRYRYSTTPAPTAAAPGRAFQRLDAMVYPDMTPDASGDETLWQMSYGGPVDAAIGRVSGLLLKTGGGPALPTVSYARMGGSTVAVTTLDEIGLQADRTLDSAGGRSSGPGAASHRGKYGGWDRFGRLVRSSWLPKPVGDGALHLAWQETYGYDLRTRKLSQDNSKVSYAYADEDWRFAYDGLDRVQAARRGTTDERGALVEAPGGKAWTLDELGNWTRIEKTISVSPPETETETRHHNAANQIIDDGALFRFYDSNGNLVLVARSSDASLPRQVFKYDAWNRLVLASQRGAGSEDHWDSTRYSYNGLNWRVAEDRVSFASDNSYVEKFRWQFYSAQWQQLMEVLHTKGAPAAVQGQEQQFWGVRGVDDAVYRRIDHTGSGVYDDGYYQLTDSSFSVVAHVDRYGAMRQWISYDTYGNPKVLLPGDFNGDGKVTTADLDQFYDACSEGSITADVNGDGEVTEADKDYFYKRWQAGISGSGAADEVRIGYAGYVVDPLTRYLLARQRWYDPVAGRWVTRDPAGYVDGMSLYLYVRGNPMGLVDPTGLVGMDGRSTDLLATSYSREAQRLTNQAWDKMGRTTADAVQKAGPVLQVAGGGLEAVAGGVTTALTWETGIGGVAGAGLCLHGVDNIQAGVRTLVSGEPTSTMTHDAVMGTAMDLGASQTTADRIGTVVDAAIPFVLGGGERAAFNILGDAAVVPKTARAADGVATASADAGAFATPTTGAAGVIPLNAEPNLTIRPYSQLSRDASIPGQAHHLNQAAAFDSIIPHNAGQSIKLPGNIIMEPLSPHRLAHGSLESFWVPFRTTSTVPTNLQYTRALQQSLRTAGLSEAQVQRAVRAAIQERLQYGVLGGMPVPRVPRAIPNLAK